MTEETETCGAVLAYNLRDLRILASSVATTFQLPLKRWYVIAKHTWPVIRRSDDVELQTVC